MKLRKDKTKLLKDIKKRFKFSWNNKTLKFVKSKKTKYPKNMRPLVKMHKNIRKAMTKLVKKNKKWSSAVK
jgi:hypothetical protein